MPRPPSISGTPITTILPTAFMLGWKTWGIAPQTSKGLVAADHHAYSPDHRQDDDQARSGQKGAQQCEVFAAQSAANTQQQADDAKREASSGKAQSEWEPPEDQHAEEA